ncbi:MAG: hypothetical protein ACO1OG_03760 [Devosia sp.]
MQKLLLGALLALSLTVAPALAQSDAEVDASIDAVLGDHVKYREAFDGIQTALGEGDAAAFAAWVSYPINVVADGEAMVIGSEEQFVEQFDTILTEEIRTVIADQNWADVFVNYQGVMLGNGQVWLNGICESEGCEQFDVRVITIQSAN